MEWYLKVKLLVWKLLIMSSGTEENKAKLLAEKYVQLARVGALANVYPDSAYCDQLITNLQYLFIRNSHRSVTEVEVMQVVDRHVRKLSVAFQIKYKFKTYTAEQLELIRRKKMKKDNSNILGSFNLGKKYIDRHKPFSIMEEKKREGSNVTAVDFVKRKIIQDDEVDS